MGWPRRSLTFGGGVFLTSPVDTAAPAVRRLVPAALLCVPLAQRDEEPSRPVVKKGQTVAAGDLLAEHAPRSGRVHSPVAGTVGAITVVDTPYRTGVPAVEMHVEATREANDDGSQVEPFEAGRLSPRELLDRVAQAGIDLPESRALTEDDRVERIVVSGIDADPHQTANLRSLADHAGELLWTATLLHEVFRARRTHLVVDDGRPDVVRALTEMAHRFPVRVLGVADRYPQNVPELLAKTVAGNEVPCGKEPIDVGIWVIDACTVMDMHRALVLRQPHTWETVTIAGDAVVSSGNYRVALGTTIRDAVDQVGLRKTPQAIVAGGVLNGRMVASPEAVLTKRTRCVSVWSALPEHRRHPVSCIRCGACLEACPVGLDPRALLDLAERGRFAAAASRFPQACLDCASCDCVCPSALPLMRGVRTCRDHVS